MIEYDNHNLMMEVPIGIRKSIHLFTYRYRRLWGSRARRSSDGSSASHRGSDAHLYVPRVGMEVIPLPLYA